MVKGAPVITPVIGGVLVAVVPLFVTFLPFVFVLFIHLCPYNGI